jgi:tetratricopeptide (TPR) repeat protein
MATNNLAWILDGAKRFDEAEALYRDSYEMGKKFLGLEYPTTVLAMGNLAKLLSKQQRWSEAVPLHRAVLEARRRSLPAGSPALGVCLINLSEALLHVHPAEEAEPLLREGLQIYEKRLPDDWRRFHAQSMLGRCLTLEHRFAEAEPLLLACHEGLKARADKIGIFKQSTLAKARKWIVELYEKWGKPEKADAWKKITD